MIPHLVAVGNKLDAADNIWLGSSLGAWVVAMLVGTTLLGNEDSPLTFYFARPVTAFDIYLGKLVGGVVLALVGQAIFIAVGGLALPGTSRLGELGADALLVTVACVAVGTLVGVAVRSRSRWLAIDVIAVIGGVIAIAATISHLTDVRDRLEHGDRQLEFATSGALERLGDRIAGLELGLLVVTLVGSGLAGVLAVSAGRTDRARSHAVMSSTLWPIVVPAIGVAMAVAWHAV